MGSKNKKTLEREAAEKEAGITKVKHGRGRPLGSKNKKTLEREANAVETVKRGKGRPLGSKNKKTLEREAAAKKAEIAAAKRAAKKASNDTGKESLPSNVKPSTSGKDTHSEISDKASHTTMEKPMSAKHQDKQNKEKDSG